MGSEVSVSICSRSYLMLFINLFLILSFLSTLKRVNVFFEPRPSIGVWHFERQATNRSVMGFEDLRTVFGMGSINPMPGYLWFIMPQISLDWFRGKF